MAKTYNVCLLFPNHALTDHLPIGDGLVAFGFVSELARRGHRLHVIAQRTAIAQALPSNVTIHLAAAKKRSIGARLKFIFRSRAIVRHLLAVENVDLIQQLNPVSNGMSLGMVGLDVPVILGTFVANWPASAIRKQNVAGKAIGAVVACARLIVSRLQEDAASAFLLTTTAALSRFSSVQRISGRVYWIPHGIDTSIFRQLEAASDRPPTILFLSSISVKKGIFTLLAAFQTVNELLPDAVLEIAGDGEARGDVERYVATMPARRQVRLLGSVDHDAVPALMANASVYCLPSLGEPYATTVIEAMACGKPVVVSDSGGLRDMVSNEGGRCVQPGDAKELAAALIEILRSPSLQRKMGGYNRGVAEREYNWPRVIEKLESVYERVLLQHDTGSRR